MDTSTNSVPESPTAPSMPAGKMRIGAGKRFWAALLDGFIIIITGSILGSLLGSSLDFLGSIGTPSGLSAGTTGAIWLCGLANSILEGATGASLGKMITKIQIGDQNGLRAKASQLWLRWLSKNIGLICTILAGILGIKFIGILGNILGFVIVIGFFFIFAAKRQAFHDMLAKTAVYSKKDIA